MSHLQFFTLDWFAQFQQSTVVLLPKFFIGAINYFVHSLVFLSRHASVVHVHQAKQLVENLVQTVSIQEVIHIYVRLLLINSVDIFLNRKPKLDAVNVELPP